MPSLTPATVLVVEHEPQVQWALRDILARAGFTVLLARNGEKALQIYEQHRRKVDLLVIDDRSPEIEQLTSQHPELKVLRLSGFAEGESVSDLPVLNKPFTPGHWSRPSARCSAGRKRPGSLRSARTPDRRSGRPPTVAVRNAD